MLRIGLSQYSKIRFQVYYQIVYLDFRLVHGFLVIVNLDLSDLQTQSGWTCRNRKSAYCPKKSMFTVLFLGFELSLQVEKEH
jgi:hypothetical protein